MGNWRTVQIIGTCDPAEVSALIEACRWSPDGGEFHPLTNAAGIMGLNEWAAAEINRLGNLAERGYSVEDVAAALRRLVEAAPSLRLKVHCGDEEESREVVATVTVVQGAVAIGPPELPLLPERTDAAVEGGLVYALMEAQKRRQRWG